MAIYDAAVVESASISASRNIGGGFSTGGFASGAFDNLGDIFRTTSGDLFLSSVVNISSVSEFTTGTDLMGIARFTNPSVSESAIAIADDIATIVNVNISVNEFVVINDTIETFLTFPASVNEFVQIALTPLSPRIGFLCLINESAQGSETIATLVVLTSTVEENVIALDIINTIANMTSGVEEVVVIEDVTPTNAVYNIPLSDIVLLSDLVSGRLLWEPINTSETTDWVLIDTVN